MKSFFSLSLYTEIDRSIDRYKIGKVDFSMKDADTYKIYWRVGLNKSFSYSDEFEAPNEDRTYNSISIDLRR